MHQFSGLHVDDQVRGLTTLASSTENLGDLIEGFNQAHFITSLIKLPLNGEVQYFPIESRPHLLEVVTSPYPNQVWIFGRQTGKSSLLAATDLAFVNLNKYVTVLYVSPSIDQTKRFSLDRMREMIRNSDLLNHLKKGMNAKLGVPSIENVFEQEFPITRSKILMRYALRSADRIRGYSADVLDLDEAQDLLSDVIDVITETIEQSAWKIKRLIGTPKDSGTPLQQAWNASTQNEWAVPCTHCGVQKGPSRNLYWSIVQTIKSIGQHGLACERCGGLIHTLDGRWVQFKKRTHDLQYEGFRFPQPSLYKSPDVWKSFYYKTVVKGLPDELLLPEVLALPINTAEDTISEEHVVKLCSPKVSLYRAPSAKMPYTFQAIMSGKLPVYVGFDWMGGNKSYTSMTAGVPLPNRRIAVAGWKIFTGADRGRLTEMPWILEFLSSARVVMSLADVGNGIDRNPDLLRLLGPQRFRTIRYSDTIKHEFTWNMYDNEYIAHREKLLAAIIQSIQRNTLFDFPPMDELRNEGIDRHLYALKKKIRRLGGDDKSFTKEDVYYDHAEDEPDDGMQSLAYMAAAFFLSPSCGPDNPWMPYTLKFKKK